MINIVLSFTTFVAIKWAFLKIRSASREGDNAAPMASPLKLPSEFR